MVGSTDRRTPLLVKLFSVGHIIMEEYCLFPQVLYQIKYHIYRGSIDATNNSDSESLFRCIDLDGGGVAHYNGILHRDFFQFVHWVQHADGGQDRGRQFL